MQTSPIGKIGESLLVRCVGMPTIQGTVPLAVCQTCPNHLRVVDDNVICNFKSVAKSQEKILHQFQLLLDDLPLDPLQEKDLQ